MPKIYLNGSFYDRAGQIGALAGNNLNSGGSGGAEPDVEMNSVVDITAGNFVELYYYTANGNGTNRAVEFARVSVIKVG